MADSMKLWWMTERSPEREALKEGSAVLLATNPHHHCNSQQSLTIAPLSLNDVPFHRLNNGRPTQSEENNQKSTQPQPMN